MATTEEASNSISHPSYPEMILAAIAALGEKDGSNKSSITKYIETTYADTLPEGYTSAISETLTKLKESSELLLSNNLYSKPDPISPPLRRRGRPKKPKPTLPPGASPPTPRPRGRPPKPKNSLSDAVNPAGGIPRRRGRPPKPKDSNGAASKPAGGTPRRRGRPSKPKDSNGAASKPAGGTSRRSGRPPKKNRPAVSLASRAAAKGGGASPAVSGVKRGRGRPPKVKPTAAE